MEEPFVFTAPQKVELRRYCGYKPRRTDMGNIAYGVLVNQAGEFEYVLNHLTADEGAKAVLILKALATLEKAVDDAMANLSTDKAAVWTRNKSEVQERRGLYMQRRRDLCDFLGVPVGPMLLGRGAGGVRWTQ